MMSSVYDPTAVQAQFTAFDPYAQQAQYEAMLQAEYARQQAEAAQQQQQQQQYYALQMQATQFQPLVPQKTAVYGCVLPLYPAHRGTDVARRQLKQPLCPIALPRTHVRLLLAAAKRIRNARPRAWPRTPALDYLRLVARILATPTHAHLVSCGRAGRRSWHEHRAGRHRHVREYRVAPLRGYWAWRHCAAAAPRCGFCCVLIRVVHDSVFRKYFILVCTTTYDHAYYRALCMSNLLSLSLCHTLLSSWPSLCTWMQRDSLVPGCIHNSNRP
jgi:hypothetical protein